jgi:hypothetical protein
VVVIGGITSTSELKAIETLLFQQEPVSRMIDVTVGTLGPFNIED